MGELTVHTFLLYNTVCTRFVFPTLSLPCCSRSGWVFVNSYDGNYEPTSNSLRSPSKKFNGIITVKFLLLSFAITSQLFPHKHPSVSTQNGLSPYMTLIEPVSSIMLVIIHCLALHLRFSKLGERRVGHKFSPDYIRLIYSHCHLQSFFFFFFF